MFKIIKKIFTSPEEIDNSSITVETILEEPDKKTLFDEAVKKVTGDKLKERLIKFMTESCYTAEQIKDTRKAKEFYKNCSTPQSTIIENYPNVIFHYRYDSYRVGLKFDLNRFCDRILEDIIK